MPELELLLLAGIGVLAVANGGIIVYEYLKRQRAIEFEQKKFENVAKYDLETLNPHQRNIENTIGSIETLSAKIYGDLEGVRGSLENLYFKADAKEREKALLEYTMAHRFPRFEKTKKLQIVEGYIGRI